MLGNPLEEGDFVLWPVAAFRRNRGVKDHS